MWSEKAPAMAINTKVTMLTVSGGKGDVQHERQHYDPQGSADLSPSSQERPGGTVEEKHMRGWTRGAARGQRESHEEHEEDPDIRWV